MWINFSFVRILKNGLIHSNLEREITDEKKNFAYCPGRCFTAVLSAYGNSAGPALDNFKTILAGFEKETGIKVEFEAYGEEQLNQKLNTEFVAGNAGIDVFMTRPLQEGSHMELNGWYEDIRPYAEANADYDLADFTESSRDAVTFNEVMTGIPLVTEQEILYYRKDILEEKGIAVPTTLDELKAAAEKLNDPANNFYGFVARGQRSPLVTQFSSFLYSYGGDWYDKDTWTATIDTPEFLQAVETYAGLLQRQTGRPLH